MEIVALTAQFERVPEMMVGFASMIAVAGIAIFLVIGWFDR